MLLENYIREILLLSERNMPKLLSKPFDYDLLIADLNQLKLASIYKKFQEKSLNDCFVDVSMSSGDYTKKSISNEDDKKSIYKKIRDHGSLVTIVLKKDKKTINTLKEDPYNFNFANCNLIDSKPILCLNKQSGDIFEEKDEAKQNKKIEAQLKDQKFTELEDWNWAAHDFHHGEVRINTKGKEFIDISKIGGDDEYRLKSKYKPKHTGYDYMDKKQSLVITDEYWLKIIGLYFNKTLFTKGVDGIDIWPSIYSYCLTKMSSPEDADTMDFKIVNEKGKKPLILGDGEQNNLRRFFKSAYKNVHKFSILSRFSSDPSETINKLKDNCIYICFFS